VNLWRPADAGDGHDFGAHGEFDQDASGRSYQLWASQHRGLLGALAAAGVTGLVTAGLRRAGRGRER
jgi:hypothetical protein